MRRLIYISTARTIVTRAELGSILRVSRANNVRVEVTGLLVTGGKRFLQALEGPDDPVEKTFERIKLDQRHFAAVVLSREIVGQRAFGTWAMGCQISPELGGAGSMSTEVAFLTSRIKDDRVRAEFQQFAMQHAA